MPTKQVLKKFAANTTLVGLPKIVNSSHRVARYLWALLCVVALITMIVQVVFIVQTYLSYPKKVLVEVKSEPMPFPAISLCNMRNMRPVVLNTLNEMFIRDNRPEHHLNASDPFIQEYMKTIARYSPFFYTYKEDVKYKNFMEELYTGTYLSANIPRHLIEKAGIQKEQFFVRCKFGHKRCNTTTDFYQWFHAHYFNCFTYHSASNRNSDQKVLVEGVENGWSSIVYSGNGAVQKNENLSFVKIIPGSREPESKIFGSEGVRVVIHPPGTYPDPLTEGFDVPPGFSASFGIKPVKAIRLGEPYGRCNDTLKFGNRTFPFTYRLIDCQNVAQQHTTVMECGCRDISLIELPDSDYEPCRKNDHFPDECMFNMTQKCFNLIDEVHEKIHCMKRVRHNLVEDPASILESHNCFPPCQEVSYDVSYSLSKWPASSFETDSMHFKIFRKEKFVDHFKDPMTHDYFLNSNREKVMQDFSRINVYITHSHVFTTEEMEDYSLTQMLSDIGGQLGLWVGISLITAMELLELVIDVLNNLYRGKKESQGKLKKSKDQADNGPTEMSLMQEDNNADV